MTFHLADLATPITDAEVEALSEVVRPFAYVAFRKIGHRGAICSWPSGEGLQFITRRDPAWVRWLAMEWNERFKAWAEEKR